METVGEVTKTFGAVTASLAVSKATVAGWKAGPGKRRAWIRGYRKLAPSVRPVYVEQMFGQATFSRDIPNRNLIPDEELSPGSQDENKLVTAKVWMLGKDGYLTTWESGDAVIAYSLTAARWRFCPKIRVGPDVYGRKIRLGWTRFSVLEEPNAWRSFCGAHNFGYIEEHYFGNPGEYQTWMCGVSDVGYQRNFARPLNAKQQQHQEPNATGNEDNIKDRWLSFRSGASINSILIAGGAEINIQFPTAGPPAQVRLLHRLGPLSRLLARYRR